MRTDDDLKLLDAVLADDDWISSNARAHAAGLGSLRARKKARRRVVFGAQICLAILGMGLCGWLLKGKSGEYSDTGFVRSADSQPCAGISTKASVAGTRLSPLQSEAPNVRAVASQAREDSDSPYITEEQMLKMFPAGSCLIAEVNGEKHLVFLSASDGPN